MVFMKLPAFNQSVLNASSIFKAIQNIKEMLNIYSSMMLVNIKKSELFSDFYHVLKYCMNVVWRWEHGCEHKLRGY